MNKIIDREEASFIEEESWGRERVISKKQWKELFKDMGIKEDKIPEWMYKAIEQPRQQVVNSIWRSA